MYCFYVKGKPGTKEPERERDVIRDFTELTNK